MLLKYASACDLSLFISQGLYLKTRIGKNLLKVTPYLECLGIDQVLCSTDGGYELRIIGGGFHKDKEMINFGRFGLDIILKEIFLNGKVFLCRVPLAENPYSTIVYTSFNPGHEYIYSSPKWISAKCASKQYFG